MARRARAALTSLVACAALVFLLASVEGAFDNSIDTTNLLGVVIVALSAIAAAALGAWQGTVGGYRIDGPVLAAAVAPPAVLAILLAVLSGAPTAINVAIAVAGALGAAVGAYLFRRTSCMRKSGARRL